VVGINLSLIIARIVLDLTLIMSYVISDLLPLPDPRDLAASLFGNLYFNVFVIIAFIIVIFIIFLLALALLMLLLRILLIYFMIVVSPFVMLFLLFPGKHTMVVNWFKRLVLLGVLGPLVTFIIYVGVFVSSSVYQAFVDNSGLMRAFVGMATVGIVIALPFILDSFLNSFSLAAPQSEEGAQKKPDQAASSSTTVITREEKKQAVEFQEKRTLTLDHMDLSKLSPASFFRKQPPSPKTESVVDTSAPLVQGNLSKKPVDMGKAPVADVNNEQPADQSKPVRPEAQKEMENTSKKSEETLAPAPASPAKVSESARQTAHYQRVRKLFNAIPKNLLLNILNDQEKKTLIRDGIIVEGADIESEKAVTIFDAPTGRELITEMNTSDNVVERNAAAVLIGKVFEAYPDRMQQVAETKASPSSPTSQQTAFAILQSGVRQLAHEYAHQPEDDRLQKAAERLVRYAPRMISAMTAQENPEQQEFIRYGISKLASSIGSTLKEMDGQKPLLQLILEGGDKSSQVVEYRNLAAEVLGRADIDVVPFLENEPDRLFISSGALSKSEYGRAVMAKVVSLVAEHPEDPHIQSLAAMVFRQTPLAELGSLAASIHLGTNALLNSPEYQKKNDLPLMYSYLRAIDQPQIASLPPLDAQQFMRSDAHMYTSLAPEAEREKVRLEFPLQVVMSTGFDPLKEYAPHLVTQALENLPLLVQTNPVLAYLSGMKLFLEGDAKTSSSPVVREVVKKAIEQSETEKNISPERLRTVSHEYLSTVSEDESSHLSETPGLSRQMLHHGLAVEPGQLEDIEKRAPHVLKQNSLLASMTPSDAVQLLANLPWDQIASQGQSLLASALSAATGAALRQGTVLDPETAAKYVLMTPEQKLNEIPWEMIRQVLEFLVKMDHKLPLYAELFHRVAPLNPAETAAQGKAVEQSVSDALSVVKAADFAALKSIDTDVVNQALEEAMAQTDLEPELAAKLLRLLPADQLSSAPDSLRDGTSQFLAGKQTYTADDAETAARLVAATPQNMLRQLNDNILTLAATIARSNVSFADREQLQTVITHELQELISPNHASVDDDE